MKFLKSLTALAAGAGLSLTAFSPARAADDTVKVGVLHSLSGTMAISETSLRDVLLFAFDEINAKGGVLGKKIEPVVVDGASNWPLFAEKAKQLLEVDKVSVVFGCWTSVSRKSVLPVFEKDNGLLFYPVQYEGEEMSRNIFYTAEAVNQQAIPAVDYLLEDGRKKFYLIGTDYVYPQTTNLVLLEYLLSKGIPIENIGGGLRKDETGKVISAGKYTPFGHTDYQQIVAEIKQFAATGDACVINTINGDSNVPFFKEFAASGLTAEDCPVASLSLSEDELRSLPTKDLVGQLGCWAYFMSIDSPANTKFKSDFFTWLKTANVSGIERENRVGRNGVGKTTTLKSIIGIHRPTSGRIIFNGEDISRVPAEMRARAGIGYVPQGRGIFPHLTVEENLFIGAIAQGKKPQRAVERVYALFPILKDFLARKGGMLSGGQQQQLAIGRALLTEPSLLILDEPTEGIQPNIIDQIGDAIKLLRRGGHHDEPGLLAEASQTLKKLRLEIDYPDPALLDQLADEINVLRRVGSQKDSAAFESLSTTFAAVRKQGPHDGNVLGEEIASALARLHSEKSMTILLVEQYLDFCRELADNFAILDRGTVVAHGTAADLTDEVVKAHLTV